MLHIQIFFPNELQQDLLEIKSDDFNTQLGPSGVNDPQQILPSPTTAALTDPIVLCIDWDSDMEHITPFQTPLPLVSTYTLNMFDFIKCHNI